MHILMIGMTYHDTPVNIREKLTIPSSRLKTALAQLRAMNALDESVIVSTCNRTEVYVVCDRLRVGRADGMHFFTEWFHCPPAALAPYLRVKADGEAILHLFRVTCGLDSMILGETQILGQVRDSFRTARAVGTTGAFFNELFKEALTVAKRGQDETQINDHPLSVSYAAVKLLRQVAAPLENKSVVIIGAGEMSRLALKHFRGNGVRNLTIVNRTQAKADLLARQFRGHSAAFDRLDEAVKISDIVFAATSAPGFLVTEARLSSLVAKRGQRPLILVDIGVPRNIDPAVARLENVRLFDIDDLNHIVDESLRARRRAAQRIERLIDRQMKNYLQWLQTLGVVPVISALRHKAQSIHTETMERIERKLPNMTERERKVISKQSQSMLNQLLRDPIAKIKELSGCEHGRHAIRHFAEIFNLPADVKVADEKPESAADKPVRRERSEAGVH
ncbi:MAG: glutamyl-tRNA reductase [Sporolactobacillus sp.]|nr:glutamyl-tRNA reductase [Sporolactobacillus sp.]